MNTDIKMNTDVRIKVDDQLNGKVFIDFGYDKKYYPTIKTQHFEVYEFYFEADFLAHTKIETENEIIIHVETTKEKAINFLNVFASIFITGSESGILSLYKSN